MIQKYPKRLIEVDLPIKRISAHARREKSIRHGHISTLHIWWARRPLAACRAVICASLWPDPADPLCPQDFRDKASEIIFKFASAAANNRELGGSCDQETWIKWQTLAKESGLDSKNEAHWNVLRFALLDFIADFANWDNSTVQEYLDTSRALTQAAHEALGGESGTRPLVVDPFAGGGSIPLEALRVGADAFASDLNPIPVLLNKVVLEYIPKYGQTLADEVRKWGSWIKQKAEKELTQFYPARRVFPSELQKRPLLLIDAKSGGFGFVTVTDAQRHLDEIGGEYTHYVPVTTDQAHAPTALGAVFGDIAGIGKSTEQRLKKLGAIPINFIEEKPIAYLWARTIQCEGPGCGAEVPLIRTLLIANRTNCTVALQLVPDNIIKRVKFRLIRKMPGGWVDDSDHGTKANAPKFEGTVKRGSVTCPCCGYTTPLPTVKAQLRKKRGGTDSAQLVCVMSTNNGASTFHLPTKRDLDAVSKSADELIRRSALYSTPLSYVPEETTEGYHVFVNRGPLYGMSTWNNYFNPRQALSLASIGRLIRKAGETLQQEDAELAVAVETCLAFALDKCVDYLNSCTSWMPRGTVGHLFSRQAIPMTWDFPEANPVSDFHCSWGHTYEWPALVCENLNAAHLQSGHAALASATAHVLPDASAMAVVTDPPYYYSVQYADLADFFYVWLRRVIGDRHGDLFASLETPKDEEIIVQSPTHEFALEGKNRIFYETKMRLAMKEARRILTPSGVGVVVFAHTSTSGWESQLQAMVDAGWVITGSWPIDTERSARILALDRSVLASSVHLVCRPRRISSDSGDYDDIGDWREVLHELPRRIHEWMPRLATEGVVGADAIFSCLGPALEVYSRYSRVEKANGEPVALGEYLEHVWAAVAKEALALVFEGADATGFEADARLTAMWLWTLKAPDSNGHTEDAGGDEDSEDEQESKKPKVTGFKLEYDAARKIAQGLGAHLESLTHLVEVSGDQARLLPVAERTKHLFGKDEEEPTRAGGKKKSSAQLNMFAELTEGEDAEVAWKEKTVKRVGETALDRVHQAMILFAAGRGEALKRFVVEDGVGQDGKFWRLAQALSALYPPGTDEKRWVDGVLARKKQFGF